jgi:hypothetical protein
MATSEQWFLHGLLWSVMDSKWIDDVKKIDLMVALKISRDDISIH